jgi:hypothetical protein
MFTIRQQKPALRGSQCGDAQTDGAGPVQLTREEEIEREMSTALLSVQRMFGARRAARFATPAAALAALGTLLALLAASGPASAALYVGQLFVPTYPCTNTTYLQTGVAPGINSYTVPSYGAITSWTYYTGTEPVPGLALKVARPDGGGVYTIIAESVAGKQLTNQPNTYTTDIGVEPGDVIGIYTTGTVNNQFCGTASRDSGNSYVYALGNWSPGATGLFATPVEGTEHPGNEPPYAIFPVQAFVSGTPYTTLQVPECSAGSFLATVTADIGTVPKALHYTVDGGPELTAKASSTTGLATIKGVPVGVHSLEWWAEDKAGSLETAHHTASVFVTKEKPHLSVLSDQNKSVYNHGERGSISISASSPHGIAINPDAQHVPIETTRAGLFLFPSTTTDNCGNTMNETFSYTVAPMDKHLRLSHSVFKAAHSGGAVAGRATGTQISYTSTDEGATNFTVIKGAPGIRRGRRCVPARKGKPGGKPCTRFGENIVGEFSHPNEPEGNSFLFTGRVGSRPLKPGTYRLEATPETGGITGPTVRTAFTIVP